MMKERDRSLELVARARAAGYDPQHVTVDTQVAGARHRDKRNVMQFPPQLTPATFLDAAPKVGWWWNFLTTEPLTFAAISSWEGTVGELLDAMFDPGVDEAALAEVREAWGGRIVVKGVQSLEDARRLAGLGVDAITLSNHGGRQLDRAPVPFLLLPEVVREVGSDLEVHLDTGIMSGADIRIAAPETRLSIREVQWGLVPDMAGCVLLVTLGLLRFKGRRVTGLPAPASSKRRRRTVIALPG